MISEKKSCYVPSTQIAITVIYTCNMFVLFCACDVMNVLSVKKNEKLHKKLIRKRKKKKGYSEVVSWMTDNTIANRKKTK